MSTPVTRVPKKWSHPLAMRPTGWFQIGWSGEFPPGAIKPLKYFGQDLVAFRSESGELSVLDAHCHHLGAHLGYGGKVKGNCVICPYHGWEWNTAGENTRIPYQDKPIAKRMRRWHVHEHHEVIFMWHDPAGGAPRWPVPNIFECIPGRPVKREDYYQAYPHANMTWPGEPICPQQGIENGPDTMHFRYTHHAPEDPVLLDFEATETAWLGHIGFISPRTKEVAMHVRAHHSGVSLVFAEFGGRNGYRLLLAHTPVDEAVSDMRVSYWFPRPEGETSGEMPQKIRDLAQEIFVLSEEDLLIWRHQKFVERPVFAAQDVAAYTSFRKYCLQFYEDAPDSAPKRMSA